MVDRIASSSLNGREWALLAWAAVILLAVVVVPAFRPAVAPVLRAAFRWRLVGVVLGLWIVVSLATVAASTVGLWGVGLLKDTVVWACGAGVLLAFRGVNSRADGWLSVLIVEVLGVTTALQLVGSLYSFSFVVEAAMLPLIVLVAAVRATADHQGQETVKQVASGVLLVWGAAVLIRSGVSLIESWEHVDWGFVSRQAALPLWLTLVTMPMRIRSHWPLSTGSSSAG